MDCEQFSVSAPGKLMVLGEHAVLKNRHAIVCAINQRIRIKCIPRSDEIISIESSLGQFSSPIGDISVQKPFQFILSVMKKYNSKLDKGFHLKIDSDFSDKIGLGSSAAVTVAAVALINRIIGETKSKNDIFQESFNRIREVQGTGSGADVAASVFGGVILYRVNPLTIKSLNANIPIVVVNSGYKTPTVEVIDLVEERYRENTRLCEQIYKIMEDSCHKAASAINNEEWPNLGELLNINQGLMDAIGVNDKDLASIVYDLRKCPGIFGTKISGSGLGDCIIGIGSVIDTPNFTFPILPLSIEPMGVRFDD